MVALADRVTIRARGYSRRVSMVAALFATANGAVTAVAAAAYFVVVVGGLGFFLWRASRLVGHPEGVPRSDLVVAGVASALLLFMIAGGFFFFGFLNVGE
jgi:hypothetical protein